MVGKKKKKKKEEEEEGSSLLWKLFLQEEMCGVFEEATAGVW